MAATSMVLENTGVKAYSGQVLNISNPAYVVAAASILTVEARHASLAGLLVKATVKNISPDGGAFAESATEAQILKAVKARSNKTSSRTANSTRHAQKEQPCRT